MRWWICLPSCGTRGAGPCTQYSGEFRRSGPWKNPGSLHASLGQGAVPWPKGPSASWAQPSDWLLMGLSPGGARRGRTQGTWLHTQQRGTGRAGPKPGTRSRRVTRSVHTPQPLPRLRQITSPAPSPLAAPAGQLVHAGSSLCLLPARQGPALVPRGPAPRLHLLHCGTTPTPAKSGSSGNSQQQVGSA